MPAPAGPAPPASASPAASTSAPRLTSLPISTQTKLRSSLLIPTLPHLLSELLHNSLDAGSGRIEVWIDPSKEGQSLRVEDDGCGIGVEGLKRVGKRGESSKGGGWNGSKVGGYGFRGEALASIAALGLVEILTRTSAISETYAKVIRGSKTLYQGISSRSLGRGKGTTAIIKDVFFDIPVRQTALANASSSSTITSCRKVIETLALANPGIKWTVWEEPAIGSSTGMKRILHVSSCKNSVEIFRSVYGTAGVESIRVSSGSKRIDGFISLEGALTKSHQHLYLAGYPLDRCDLHSVISKRFAQSKFSSMVDDGADYYPTRHTGNKRSPRRLERYPIYVLNVQIPSTELDAAYTPGKTVMGYKDEEAVKAFILAVVDEFLRRHEFVRGGGATSNTAQGQIPIDRPMSIPLQSMLPPTTPLPASRRGSRSARSVITPHCDPITGAKSSILPRRGQSPIVRPFSTPLGSMFPPVTPLPLRPVRPQSAVTPTTQGRLAFPQAVQSSVTKRKEAEFTVDASGRKRYKWIDEILAVSSRSVVKADEQETDTGVLSFTPNRQGTVTPEPFSLRKRFGDPCCSHDHAGYLQRPHAVVATATVEAAIIFSRSDLATAEILGQVDNKFICAAISSATEGKSVVLIDQHAADERVSVEVILRELCEGFMADSIPITEVQEPLPAVVLSKEEVAILLQPGVRDMLARWGIELDISNVGSTSESYTQVPVTSVPTVLKARLGRKEATEMTRLIKMYLPVMSADIGQMEAVLRGSVEDWGKVLRWMPKEMLELANSKACRSE